MANFRYTAKDRTGKTMTAVLESPDEKAVLDSLKRQGLMPISVALEKGKKAKGAAGAGGSGRGKVKLAELVLFSRQLATMIDSGIALVQALEILTEQIENKNFKVVVEHVKDSVSSGSSFHDALAKHPNAFAPLFVQMVKAGETSGALVDIMDRLAGYVAKNEHLVWKGKFAMD